MKLGTEVGLGPGDIVLDGDPAPLPQRGTALNFGPMWMWPNGWLCSLFGEGELGPHLTQYRLGRGLPFY